MGIGASRRKQSRRARPGPIEGRDIGLYINVLFRLISRLFSPDFFLIGYHNLGYILFPGAATLITGIDPVFPLSGIWLLKNLYPLGTERIPIAISAPGASHNYTYLWAER